MIAVGVDLDNQLVPLAFVLAKDENDDSWCWFMKLVRQNVLRSSQNMHDLRSASQSTDS